MNDSSTTIKSLSFLRRYKNVSILTFFIIVGLVLVSLGVLSTFKTGINSGWKRIDGRIISVETRDQNGTEMYVLTVSYQVNALNYQTVSNVAEPTQPQVGTLREVAYDPKIPLRATVVQPSIFTTLSYILPTVGVVVILIGLVTFSRLRSKAKKNLPSNDSAEQASILS